MNPRLLFLGLLLSLVPSDPARAAIRVIEDLPALSMFEFYGNGLYYWGNAVSGCGGEFGREGVLATVAYRGPRFKDPPFQVEGFRSPVHVLARDCDLPQYGGVARDDAFVYYSERQGIFRLPLSATNDSDRRLIGVARNTEFPGALLIHNGRLYFAASSSSVVSGNGGENLGRFQIYYFGFPTTNLFDPDFLVSHGGSMPTEQPGRIKKLAIMTIRKTNPLSGGQFDAEVGLALGERGLLLRFDLDDFPLFNSADPVILARNVTDFAVRRDSFEEFGGPISPRPVTRDIIYAAVNSDPTDPCSSGGAVVQIDPYNGAQGTFWSAPPGARVTAFGLDDSYLFASTHQVTPDGGLGCIEGQPVICSKRWLANRLPPTPSGIDPNWNAIELDSGSNLRSDGQWLYFVRSNTIWRITNASPPVRFDLAALGLETVQVIQDLNNSIRLVEGKRTVVRGYARVADSTLPQIDWFPNASLRGFLNGVELPGSPLQASQNAQVTSAGEWPVLRTNLARSFLFELPDEWVRRGQLNLRMTVNPAQAIYESGADPLGNNTTEATPTVVTVDAPCLVFANIDFGGPAYWPLENDGNFWGIVARARSILPVPAFDVRFTTANVRDEYLCPAICGIFPCILECDDPFNLTTGDGWSEALEELACYSGFTRPRSICFLTHFVGAIHPSVMNPAWGGLGLRPGNHLLTIMNPGPATSINSSFGGVTLAHEIGHNLGAKHVDQADRTLTSLNCGSSTPLEPGYYPYDTCTIGPTGLTFPDTPVGFDTLTYTVIPPTAAADLMSYANTVWISPHMYNAILDALHPVAPALAPASHFAPASPPAGPYLVVRGVVNLTEQRVRLKAAYTLPGDVPNPEAVMNSLAAAAEPPAHPYVIRLLDAAGAALQTTPLVLFREEDTDGQSSAFNQILVKPAAAAAVQILLNGVVLAETRASAHPPVIASVQVAPDPANDMLSVVINDSDADGDPLYHTVQFSEDGMAWRPIKVNTFQTAFVADTRRLPGGMACRVRVIATDGFHSAVATSAMFALPKHAPELFISGVNEGQRVPYGVTLALEGHGFDAEDDSLPSSAFSWSVAGLAPRHATGSALRLIGLPPGHYTVTLSGHDSDGQQASQSVAFDVLPFVVPDSSEPILDGDPNDAAYVNAATVNLPEGVTARLLHANGFLYAAVTGMAFGSSDSPAAIALRFEVDGGGSSTTTPADFALVVGEDGAPVQQQGNGAGFVAAEQPSLGVKVVISRGVNAWSAELRIPEVQLGGWNHAARLELANAWGVRIDLPGGGGFTLPILNPWPPAANETSPATWATAWFGTPPALTNRPPVARVPSNVVVAVTGPKSISLNGSDSFDSDGDPLTYQWTQVAGPAVTLANADSATPSFSTGTIAESTSLRFQLVVGDGLASSAPAETTVTLTAATSPAVAVLDGASRNDDDSVTARLLWPGNSGDRVIIQASSNLVNWVNIASNTVDWVRRVLYRDAQAGLYPYRFYRLASAPTFAHCTPSPENLVGWWRAEDDATDATGNNHGTLLKGLSFAPGKIGHALNFTSVSQELLVPSSPSLDVGVSGGITIEGWINPTDATTQYPLAEWGDDAGAGTHFWINVAYGGVGGPGALYASPRFGDLSYFASAPGIVQPNEWQHVAFTFDQASGVARLYHNGTEVASKNEGPLILQTSLPLNLGHRVGGPSFRGLMDEMALYNRALDSNEIQAIYLAGSVGKCPPVCGAPALLAQNFEIGAPSNYASAQHLTSPGPVVQSANAGSTGRFLRLINDGVNSQNNSISFAQVAPGAFPAIHAEFDFRLTSGDAPADGFAFMLIPTATYGTNGPGFVTPTAFEEPNIPGVFAVGFDAHPRAEPRNDVSVHWNGVEYANVTLADANVNLTSGSFHRALVTLAHVSGGAVVTVSLVRDVNGLPSPAYTPIRGLFIPGLNPFSSRVELAGRSGALDMNVDLDNVQVQFLPSCLTGP